LLTTCLADAQKLFPDFRKPLGESVTILQEHAHDWMRVAVHRDHRPASIKKAGLLRRAACLANVELALGVAGVFAREGGRRSWESPTPPRPPLPDWTRYSL
jgi:hypothetical protein